MSVSAWSQRNGLMLNAKKTMCICVGARVTRSRALDLINCDIVLNDSIIVLEDKARNLGVLFDSHLSFEDHVNNLCRLAYMKFKSIYSFKKSICSAVKWNLCCALILSLFTYCSSVYFPFSTQSSKYKLQKVQNCCLRYSFNIAYREHITPHYLRLNIFKVHQLLHCQYASLIFNVLKYQEPEYLFKMLQRRSEVHSVDVRNRNLFSVPHHSSEKFKGSFANMAVIIFNENCDIYNSCSSIVEFKRRFKLLVLPNL